MHPEGIAQQRSLMPRITPKGQILVRTICVFGIAMLLLVASGITADGITDSRVGYSSARALSQQDHRLAEGSKITSLGIVSCLSDVKVSQSEEEETPVATVVPLPTAIATAGPPPAPCIPIALLALIMLVMACVLVRGAGLIDRRSRLRDQHEEHS